MPWDQSRNVPWKRLFMFEGIYIALFAVFVAIFQGSKFTSGMVTLGFAVVVTTMVLYAAIKMGWDPMFLKSREEMARIRAQRIAERNAARARKSGKPAAEPERYRPAPTRRTSTGPTNRQRRTRDTRKR